MWVCSVTSWWLMFSNACCSYLFCIEENLLSKERTTLLTVSNRLETLEVKRGTLWKERFSPLCKKSLSFMLEDYCQLCKLSTLIARAVVAHADAAKTRSNIWRQRFPLTSSFLITLPVSDTRASNEEDKQCAGTALSAPLSRPPTPHFMFAGVFFTTGPTPWEDVFTYYRICLVPPHFPSTSVSRGDVYLLLKGTIELRT